MGLVLHHWGHTGPLKSQTSLQMPLILPDRWTQTNSQSVSASCGPSVMTGKQDKGACTFKILQAVSLTFKLQKTGHWNYGFIFPEDARKARDCWWAWKLFFLSLTSRGLPAGRELFFFFNHTTTLSTSWTAELLCCSTSLSLSVSSGELGEQEAKGEISVLWMTLVA